MVVRSGSSDMGLSVVGNHGKHGRFYLRFFDL